MSFWELLCVSSCISEVLHRFMRFSDLGVIVMKFFQLAQNEFDKSMVCSPGMQREAFSLIIKECRKGIFLCPNQ